eukprot:331169_1
MEGVKNLSIQAGKLAVPVFDGLFINNKFVASVDGKKFETINPATGRVLAEVFEASAADVDLAVDAAEKAFNGEWGEMKPVKRSKILMKIADLLEANVVEMAHLEAADNGRAVADIRDSSIPKAAECFRYFAGMTDKLSGKTLNHSGDMFAYTRREPMGVCGAILPWNYPINLYAWKLAPALACGNTVVMKSSEKTPLSALYMANLLPEAGIPPGTVNILSGFGPTCGHAIASHMKIRKIAFTGSGATGQKIMQAAGSSNMKRVSLELGGKSPTVIFDDCNMDQAVKYASMGVFASMGQVCCAGSRIFVQEGIYEDFKKRFIQHAGKIRIGNQFDETVSHGPQIDKIQFDRVMKYIQIGKAEGATCEMGGKQVGSDGLFVEPTLFTNVTDDMTIVKEEIFGPVAVMIPFKTEAEVILRANDTEYGLAASVFTKNGARATRVAHKLQAGTVYINNYFMSDTQCAFGGYKQSGMGRDGSEYAIEQYTQIKQIVQNLECTS